MYAIRKLIDSFRGLSPEVWWLALVTLINRAGTMVIPFLSLYLTSALGYTLAEVGWVMTSFGLGSVVGSWLGGRLTDLFGNYRVMVASLALSGLMFIGLQFISGFWPLCVAIFLVMLVADAFRPAMFVALSTYSKPENKTRSVSLIRLAINLGFAMGPAVGGLIIARMGYGGLFWIDGVTCALAGILLLWALDPRRSKVIEEVNKSMTASPHSDKTYLLFLLGMMLFGLVFLQYFSTMPLYYEAVHGLSEEQIGLLLAGNGLVVFLVEMPLVKWLETKSYSKLNLMLVGGALVFLSFLILNIFGWSGILIVGMLLMSIGELMAFPFSNAWAMKRSARGKQGAYMALYTVSFSVSHIFGHNTGMQLVNAFGYEITWYIMTLLGVCCLFVLVMVRSRERAEAAAD